MTQAEPPRTTERSTGPAELVPAAVAVALVIAGAALLVAALLSGGGGVAQPSLPGSGTPAPPSAPASGSPPESTGPTASPLPTPTPQPTPRSVAETAVDLTWRSVALLPGSGDPANETVVVAGLAHGPNGYLAVGTIVEGFLTETGATGPMSPAAWRSDDALHWVPTSVAGFGDAIPSGVASSGSTILVVATTATGSSVFRANEGAWVEAGPDDARIVRLAGLPGEAPRFVAVGERLSTHRQAIWTGDGAGAWTLAWESAVAFGEQLTAIATAPGGAVLVGGTRIRSDGQVEGIALASADGVAWRRAAEAAVPAGQGLDAIGAGADGAWYGAGYLNARGGIGVWRSSDGLAWSPTGFGAAQLTEQPGDTGSATAVLAFDGRTIVLGYTSCCGDPPQRALVSIDGRTWARADRSTAIRPARLSVLLVEADRVVAVGALNRRAGVWIATAAPRNGVEFASELARPAESDVCGASTELHARLEVDRSGVVARIGLVPIAGGGEVGQVIWPFGWSAVPGPPLEVRSADGTVVAREGDEITLSGGRVTGTSYHVCELNGQAAWNR